MLFLNVLLSLCGVTSAAAVCTARERIAAGQYITDAFNEPDFVKSFNAINHMPLTPDCRAFVSVNGLPGIEFGPDANTTYAFSNTVRQAFTHVVSNYTDYGNGTMLMDAIVTLGLLRIPLPVYARIMVPIEFDLSSCLINKLPAFVFVPVNIAGIPIDPPIVPAIPGLATIPPEGSVLQQILEQGVKLGGLSPFSAQQMTAAIDALIAS